MKEKNYTRNEPYDVIASIYDKWQYSFRRPYFKVVRGMIRKEIRRCRIKRKSFLDLACGTGDISLFLAGKGWEVCGVDSSIKMLEAAERKTPVSGRRPEFIPRRIEKLSLGRSFSMAGSFYDSLNHIICKRTLLTALKRVRDHLEPDGIFVFDTNTLSCYRDLWSITSVGHETDYTLIIENSFDERTNRAVSYVTIFEKGAGSEYRKSSTRVEERWYPDDELEGLLQHAGFMIIYKDPVYIMADRENEAYKQWWVCRRE